jgi:ubiquinone biosynthesis protein
MRAFLRLISIIHVFSFYHLDELLKPLPQSWLLRWPLKLLPSYWLFYFSPVNKNNINERCKLALIQLGPIFIKLGQLLATRRDLLEDDLANELETLTEQVPPFDSAIAKAILHEELGNKINEIFKHIDEQPLASASIAQVHAAELKSGEQVVIKIIRPGIEKVVNRDLALMAFVARKIEQWIPASRLFFIEQLVANYKEVILGEINLHREAANTIKFRSNALKHSYLYIPGVYLELSTRKVMTMERIYGIPVNQADKIAAQGTDLKQLAENGVKIFFTQVFRDNFFHADMHPGNIFANTVNPAANQYVSVDCAIAGSLSKDDQLFIAQQVIALVQKNFSKNAQLFIDAGWVKKDIHKEELALRLQKIAEPLFDQPMSEIDFAPILLELFAMAREFHIHINPNFLLFQKTLIHIEGLGKQLYPQLNVWEIGKPLLEEWVKELISPAMLFASIKENGPLLIQQLPELPSLLYLALNRLKQVDPSLEVNQIYQELIELRKEQTRSKRTLFFAMAFLSGAYLLNNPASSNLATIDTSSLILATLGFSLLGFHFLKK